MPESTLLDPDFDAIERGDDVETATALNVIYRRVRAVENRQTREDEAEASVDTPSQMDFLTLMGIFF